MQGGSHTRRSILYIFNTCPIPLQWTLNQLQQVFISVESQPVLTTHEFPLSELYSFCKAVQTSGLTVLLPDEIGNSESTLEGNVLLAVVVSVEVSVGVALVYVEEVSVEEVSVTVAVAVGASTVVSDVVSSPFSFPLWSSWPIHKYVNITFLDICKLSLPNTMAIKLNRTKNNINKRFFIFSWNKMRKGE